MSKDAVTRTVSIGAICNGTSASDDFSSARRHSSAGIRALLWATSSAKSLGCSLGSDSQTSRENIFPNILTPDSIPQFTIPSLSVQSSLRSLNNAKEEDDAESDKGVGSSGTEQESSESVSLALSSLSPATPCSGSRLVLWDRRAERSVSDPLMQRRSLLQRERSYPYTEAQHCLDPASRAALSLPHLTKVTTPYGFVTLSQSPQMASEEALLCQAGLRRLTKDEETACCLRKAPETRTGNIKGNSSHLSGSKKRLSKDSTDSLTKGRSVKAEIKVSSATSSNTTASSASAARHPDGKLKRRFYEVIKKHFTSHH
ncbi:putative C2 calcium-dependent domain-containing protein 4C-like [Scophthalmus maximus]|uniref:Putative C2 calcium-dependent domain-containing protein 4C-like n=1 Tax=Scophthalmus maximus TaxID=52904 RepID=A0A2U9C5S0_SCOMX|nr:putative C2 calcium-dependent domain-containing protein 4C-like [Scophthalmus maximus]